MLKKVLYWFLGLLLLSQFIPVNRDTQSVDEGEDLIKQEAVPEEVATLLHNACYDCHSNATKYPWYSYVSPVKFILQKHVREGREELNFSDWGLISEKKKQDKLDECYEMVGEKEMPLKGYVLLHREARLSDSERQLLTDWFMSKMSGRP